jgi:mannosyltransferase OCH1-like enzyme
MIPKKLHFIWVGDETKRPQNCIDTWKKLNPSYEIKIWGNKEQYGRKWINKRHMDEMWNVELNGVADLMRYEILHSEGGLYIDADSYCKRPLEDWLLEPNEFSCWENEVTRPGLIATTCLGSVPQSPFFAQIIQDISLEKTVIDKRAWLTVGPQRVTDTWRKTKYPITIYPSHFFIPRHFSGVSYQGSGQVFADHLWGSTKQSYDSLHKLKV